MPPINFRGKGLAPAGQDIEQDNYQASHGSSSQQISARKASKASAPKPGSRGQKRAGTELEEIVSDENEDFQPFLSSTEAEYTDLNTDFNTDRGERVAGESNGPQSTYRNLNQKSVQKDLPSKE